MFSPRIFALLLATTSMTAIAAPIAGGSQGVSDIHQMVRQAVAEEDLEPGAWNAVVITSSAEKRAEDLDPGAWNAVVITSSAEKRAEEDLEPGAWNAVVITSSAE
ncbi:hypothetical protein SUNI508_07922 [Seiridium unicorne]|uniref:Uncharacterized protein n=1 Tax=Seiridium unicorne TaxID=138068 RepID=A0ABR2UWK0_9PEZI